MLGSTRPIQHWRSQLAFADILPKTTARAPRPAIKETAATCSLCFLRAVSPSKLFRRSVTRTAVRARFVVLPSPSRDLRACIIVRVNVERCYRLQDLALLAADSVPARIVGFGSTHILPVVDGG